MKYIVGIDFGTSNTIVKAKISDKTKKENLECKSVTFTQTGIPSTPTLIRKKDADCWYGHEAEQQVIVGSQLYSNFKLDLLSKEDISKKTEAINLINEFFVYLFKCYSGQKVFLFGSEQIQEETKVSYPAQWNEELREVMIDSAKKAGFKNVIGVNEATAAVHCILKAKQKELEQKGYLKIGKPLHMLVIDMGAGTTDLAFVDVMIDNKNEVRTDILKTWPPIGNERRFGGRQIDEGLEQLLIQWLIKSGLKEQDANSMVVQQRNNIKAWKENTISVSLEREESVTDFPMLSMIVNCIGIQASTFPSINKNTFETIFKKELSDFITIINSAPKQLLEQTELVILTGGNSLWYWIDDILLGRNKKFGEIALKQIIGQPSRLLRMELPTETVSRGLVYGAEIKPIIGNCNNSNNVISNSNKFVINKTILEPKEKPNGILIEKRVACDGDKKIKLMNAGILIMDNMKCRLNNWSNIIDITYCNYWGFIILKSDGTMISTYPHYNEHNLLGSNDIIAIEAGSWHDCYHYTGICFEQWHVVGLKSDGTVIAIGQNIDGQCDVNNWTNVIAIACGECHTVGLKSDGTVVATGDNSDGQCNVSNWTDIIAIECHVEWDIGYESGRRKGLHRQYTIGYKSNGTIENTRRNTV